MSVRKWRPCTAPKSFPRCADTLGPWGKGMDWCNTARLWCYDANWHCTIPSEWSRTLCTPEVFSENSE